MMLSVTQEAVMRWRELCKIPQGELIGSYMVQYGWIIKLLDECELIIPVPIHEDKFIALGDWTKSIEPMLTNKEYSSIRQYIAEQIC